MTQASGGSNPFQDIFEWSKNRKVPNWQKDALRRIIQRRQLDQADLDELELICRHGCGILPEGAAEPKAEPLAQSHFPNQSSDAADVSLHKLTGVQNVGRLAPDQTISFGPSPGLTLIFGDNGAGKSGYAQILKHACRARGKLRQIRGNEFGSTPAGPQSASIHYVEGEKSDDVVWRPGNQDDSPLRRILVFDSETASAQVAQADSAMFQPDGLDVLPKLVSACDALGLRFAAALKPHQSSVSQFQQGCPLSSPTKARTFVLALSARTTIKQVDALAVLSESESARLTELQHILQNDPETQSRRTAETARQVGLLITTLTSALSVLDDDGIEQSQATWDQLQTCKAAAAIAGPERMADDLPGTFGPVWKQLWETAEKYATSTAYPDAPYPPTTEGTKCVLCQQEMDATASERLRRFHRFVADQTQRDLTAALAQWTELKASVEERQDVLPEFDRLRHDIEPFLDDEAEDLRTTMSRLDARLSALKASLQVEERPATSVEPLTSIGSLEALLPVLEERAKQQTAAADPEKRRTFQQELEELKARKWMADNRQAIIDQIVEQSAISKLQMCHGHCDSTPVSRRAKQLATAYVNEQYCAAFKRECDALGLRTIPVELKPRATTKGKPTFAFTADGLRCSVADIASEGEYRCMALAGFLAELSQSSHRSAIVFDDPVSSLDYHHRRRLAKRIVREAEVRQVIVFTHNLALVSDLLDIEKNSPVRIRGVKVDRLGDQPGRVAEDLPWEAMNPKQQLKQLRDSVCRLVQLAKGSQDQYRHECLPVVGKFRGACERIVERHLVADVLKRHDSQIRMGNIPNLLKHPPDKWRSILELWRECSQIIDSHDNPESGQHIVPTTDELFEWHTKLQHLIGDTK